MAKRILLAWELGGGRGHLAILGPIARVLRDRGYQPVFALQRIDQAGDLIAEFGAEHFHRAPSWPGLIMQLGGIPARGPTSLADSLALAGLRFRAAVDFMIAEWEEVLASTWPAAVVADFAPACLLATRNRLPTVAVGDAYTLPPPHLSEFPNFDRDGLEPLFDSTQLLNRTNENLKARGQSPIDRLPAIFTADRYCAGSFDEIDPYRGLRQVALTAPWTPALEAADDGPRDEIFCYLSTGSPAAPAIKSALLQLSAGGIPVRLFAPYLSHEARELLRSPNLVVERAPVSIREIQSRARMLVSLGSGGLAATALAVGLPHVVIPSSLAKELTGRGIDALGTGRCLILTGKNPIEPTLLAQAIREVYEDSRMQERARELAPDFLRRTDPSAQEVAADYVDELV